MGLFDKAIKKAEAGSPIKGTGLFAKAQRSLEEAVAAPSRAEAAEHSTAASNDLVDEPLQEFEAAADEIGALEEDPSAASALEYCEHILPYSAEDLRLLAEELASLPKGLDALITGFSRISEALPLTELALFSCEPRLIRPIAAIGRCLPAEALEIGLPSFIKALSPGEQLDAEANPALSDLVEYLGEGSRKGYVRAGPDGKPFALWVYSDPSLEESPELETAFLELLSLSPLPSVRIEFVRPIKPDIAGQRIRLGQGKAAVLLFDMNEYVSQRAVLVPGLDENALLNLCRTAMAAILGAEGTVFLLAGRRLLALLYSKAVPDAELVLVQLRKSLSKALPFLGTTDFPQGRSATVDLASAEAVEIIERFAAE